MDVRVVCLAVALAMLGLPAWDAGAQTPPASPPQAAPIPPGGVRVTARNPLIGNWTCARQTCVCRPLACAADSRVSYVTAPSPARNPNPQALENFAKVEMPKRIRAANAAQGILSDGKDKFEILVSKVATYLSYPSVLSETKLIKGSTTIFVTSAMIFAGPVLVTVTSLSPDRAVALSSLNEFIAAMTIQEGPPLTTPAPMPTPVPPPASPQQGPASAQDKA